jgi:light-regulated signal transduction histidine kinase (bacteriophytochrome)/CheY-like chemotaxis protein
MSISLSSCDSEPIHLLGAIQPIGFLLSVNADWIVARASANVQNYLGVSPDEIVGRAARSFLSPDLIHDIRGRLQAASGTGIVERLFSQRVAPDSPSYDVAIHVSGRETILEFEPSVGEIRPPLSVLRSMIARVERQTSMRSLYREAVRQVRALTNFDRVMLYRFDEDGAGEVVAESANGDLLPFLGLRYPASDIPVQARALYLRNFLRIIANVDAEPVPVVPAQSPEGETLDLSMSSLRSVSPVHIEYLRNMGVKASMSISVIQDGKLWGLIACHHGAPIHLGLESRSTAELFGQMFSYLLEKREREENLLHDTRTRDVHDRIATAFSTPDSFLQNIPGFLTSVSDYIAADGVGVYHSGEINLSGLTPTRAEFLQLVRFLNKTTPGMVFSTHCLGDLFPEARDYPMRAAGVLCIPISRIPRDYLIFFRREVEKTVLWAGEPEKITALGPHGVRLTPRKSFEAWRETVRNQSLHWSKRDRHAAETLRATLIELVLRMSETAEADRSAAKQSQELLIAELNHRVRNILGLVRGLITQSAATASDVRSLVDSLDHRIRSLARAQDLLTFSDFKPTSMHVLISTEIETYGRLEDRLALTGPDVMLQPRAFVPMALVIHELVTNARKHGALSVDQGKIRVEVAADEIGNVAITWSETGGPPVSAPTRRGFGSTILEQVIPFELNGSSLSQYLRVGYRQEIVLPAAVAHCIEAPQTGAREQFRDASAVDQIELRELLDKCLLVEDNLFIAIDAEDMLHSLGADTVIIASSVAQAIEALEKRALSFALLDVSLGNENSLPVARVLRTRGIPFAFGTGYGEGLSMGEAFADVPIIAKPYHLAGMFSALLAIAPLNYSACETGE